MEKEREKIWNVPNVLTMIRLLLIPVYWVLMSRDYYYTALAVYVVASLTDLADGYIARKYNQITNFGKLMDPLADKLMVLSVMLSLVIKGILPALPLIILAVKEGLMVLGGAVMLKRGVVVYSKFIGKLAQTLVVCSLILSFFHEYWTRIGVPVHRILLWIAVVTTLCALVFYAASCVKQLKEPLPVPIQGKF